MLRENLLSLILFLVAAILSLLIWFYMPHEKEVRSLGILLFKLLPFLFASLAISTVKLDTNKKNGLQYFFIIFCFLGFFCLFVPKILFHSRYDNHVEVYYFLLITTPYVILSLVMAYRIGGGKPERAFRLSIAMLLLMLSGIEDLASLIINNYPGVPAMPKMPDVWVWASHITVFLGHPPSKYEAYVFISFHVILALIVLFFPFGKLFQNLKQKLISPSEADGEF